MSDFLFSLLAVMASALGLVLVLMWQERRGRAYGTPPQGAVDILASWDCRISKGAGMYIVTGLSEKGTIERRRNFSTCDDAAGYAWVILGGARAADAEIGSNTPERMEVYLPAGNDRQKDRIVAVEIRALDGITPVRVARPVDEKAPIQAGHAGGLRGQGAD